VASQSPISEPQVAAAAPGPLPAEITVVGGGNTFEAVSSVPVSDQWDTSAQVEIKTTEAVMRNILHSHLDALTAKDAWVPPLTVVLPIGLALLAGVKDSKVENVLYVGLGAALLWLAAKARAAYRCRGHRGIDAVIDDLRPAGRPPPSTVVFTPEASLRERLERIRRRAS
jgi:hypothetical protein